MKKKLFDSLFLLCLALTAAALLLFPQIAADGAALGMRTCAKSIIPSLFPFFVVTNLLAALGYMNFFGSSYLFAGLIGGYPVGAQNIANQYRDGQLSRSEAQRMLLYCNNSGPAFIFGVVGYGVFQSFWVGLALYLIHVASALMIRILVFKKRSPTRFRPAGSKPNRSFPAALTVSVRQAGTTTIAVSVFVVFFSILCSYFQSFLPKKWTGHLLIKLMLGALELAGGVSQLSDIGNSAVSFCLISFLLGFGGLCVSFQTYSILDGAELSAKHYIAAKLFQGLLSILLAVPVSGLLNLSGPINRLPIHPIVCLLPVLSMSILLFEKESSGNQSAHGL